MKYISTCATLLLHRQPGLLPGAVAAGEVAKKKDATLIVCCDTGDRSGKAMAALKKQGYSKVVNLSGGLGAWKQAGLPVER